MGKMYTDSTGKKLVSTTKIAFLISLIPCFITFSFFPLMITAIAPIIDFFIERKMLFLRYDESGDNHADNPNIKPESTTSHTEPSDDEVHIRQAYGLETNHRLPYQALQLPNEWVMSCLCVILIAPVAAAISIGILGVPNWWQAWWSSQLSTLSYAFWSFIL